MSWMRNITTRNELSDFLGIPRRKLTHLLYVMKTDNSYISFDIPKKNGEVRHINAPTDGLKSIQKKLAAALMEHQEDTRADEKLGEKSNKQKALNAREEQYRKFDSL